MSAYSAVVSLEQILKDQLSNSNQLPKKEVASLRGKISYLKSTLETIFPAPKIYRDKAKQLASLIREKIFEAQDTIESLLLYSQNHSPEHPETSKNQSSISLQENTPNIDLITNEAKVIGGSISEVICDEYRTFIASVFSQIDKTIRDKYKMLIQEKLTAETRSRLVIPIRGMAGISKTSLAKSIFEDVNFMKENFPYKAWVTISKNDNFRDILGKILNTLESSGQKAGEIKYEGDETSLKADLHQALSNKKYLVVVDNMWDPEFLKKLQVALPDNENNSRIILTTMEMKPLNDEDSWVMLWNKRFGDDKQFPFELDNKGRAIAKGLTGIGGLLSEGRKEPDTWQFVKEETYAGTADAKAEERDEANKFREKIFQFQYVIESIIFSQSNPPESHETSKGQSSALEKIIADIDHLVEAAKWLGFFIREIKKDSQPFDEAQTFKSSVSGQSNKIVGQKKYKDLIGKKLKADVKRREVIPICGMAGIGKTTLAKSIYHDALMTKKFKLRAWVTVSQDAGIGDITAMLLRTLESSTQKAGSKVYQGSDDKLLVELHQALHGSTYLVVIDDMWNPNILKELLNALPDNRNKSRVILTTRISDVAKSVNKDFTLDMEPLNEEDSWMLLRNRTFGDDQKCEPTELEKHGRKIAENCKGLPLSLTVIGGLLSQGRKGADYWQIIEEDTLAATRDVELEESYMGILSLSYDHLPCKLKPCFLYMTAFPEDSDIPVSKLIRLWVAEGFLTTQPPQLVEKAAEKLLLALIDRNLVLIRNSRSIGGIKSCGMHDGLRDFAEEESAYDMFFHLRKRHPQRLKSGTNAQRRVSVHKTILMSLDDVYKSTKAITNARSLLYVGAHHHHPLLFNLTFGLLRVLDAFTVFFFDFPDEILELIHLRYLSFTYNGMLPSELCQLYKLQVLIVKREPKIIYVGTPFLPDEIWYMKELRHLLITETDMPLLSPTLPGPILLENLQTLLNVNAASCTEEVLGHMPNLTKLAMWIEEPEELGFYLNKLDKLEIFKFVVLNPSPRKKIEFQPKLFFPDTVKKLCLSGCGLPWEDMEVIERLPNLEVLKLKELAFHGDKWSPAYIFEKLKYLLMEYLNLKQWEADDSNFPCLEQLILRHCYDLEEFPETENIISLENLRLIELVDCSSSAVIWAKNVQTEVMDSGNNMPQVQIYSSCE